MRKILLTSAIILAGLSAGYARGMHSIGIIEPPATPPVFAPWRRRCV
jgi:hypothetical protein